MNQIRINDALKSIKVEYGNKIFDVDVLDKLTKSEKYDLAKQLDISTELPIRIMVEAIRAKMNGQDHTEIIKKERRDLRNFYIFAFVYSTILIFIGASIGLIFCPTSIPLI